MIKAICSTALCALVLSAFSGTAKAGDIIVSDSFTGNLYLDDTQYGLYGGGVYDGPVTLSYTLDLTKLASGTNYNAPGSYDEWVDGANDGATSLTMAWGSYSETFNNAGYGGLNSQAYTEDLVKLYNFTNNGTELNVVAHNSDNSGVMWAIFANYSDPFTTQSALNPADDLTVSSATNGIQGYIGTPFGPPSDGENYWDYFSINSVQEVGPSTPEPATWALGGIGSALLVLLGRRRRAQASR